MWVMGVEWEALYAGSAYSIHWVCECRVCDGCVMGGVMGEAFKAAAAFRRDGAWCRGV